MAKRQYSILDGVGENGGFFVIDLSTGESVGIHFNTYYAAYKYIRNGDAKRDSFVRSR